MIPAVKRYFSFLAPQIEAYLELKTRLGFTSFARTGNGRDFDRYLVFRGIVAAKDIDEGLVANWMHAVPELRANTKNMKLSFARGLCRHLMRLGIIKDNPALRVPYLRHSPSYKPHIYPLKEIGAILEGTAFYRKKYPRLLLGWTLETMFFLIYACGLRLGEAVKLRICDVNLEENTLSLWKTKFHKERLVPFSQQTARKLKSYSELRQKLHPTSDPKSPFFCHAQGEYGRGTIEKRFRHILARCGIAKSHGKGPRIHDLRHTFAVHRLYKWYQEGHDPLNKLPLLSTYMGHVTIENTQVYLTIGRALLREGDRRFQQTFENSAEQNLGRAPKKR